MNRHPPKRASSAIRASTRQRLLGEAGGPDLLCCEVFFNRSADLLELRMMSRWLNLHITRKPPTFNQATLVAFMGVFVNTSAWCAAPSSPAVRLTQTQVTLHYVAYEFAVMRDPHGVPKFDKALFSKRERRIVKRQESAIILENRSLKATLLPAMGRLHSLISKATGNEQLWINPIALPLGARNDTGFWMTWGGVERVLPRGEHGTSHALEWSSEIVENSTARVAVRTWSREPLTGLRHEVVYAVVSDKPFLEARIRIENNSSKPIKCSHWTTAVLAPGGLGKVTPRTELIVPAANFVPDRRDFNEWMTDLVGPTESSPLRFIENWKSIGDLMTTPLLQPYYAVYSHEQDEGLIHMFDSKVTPGLNIWGWGFPLSVSRQNEFTADRIRTTGYIEFWNGTVRGFSNRALATLAAHQSLNWTERTIVVDRLLDTGNLREAIAARALEVLGAK